MMLREKTNSNILPRLLDAKELMAYTNLGRNRAEELGAEAGAKIRYGKRVLYDRSKLDKYLDELEPVQ